MSWHRSVDSHASFPQIATFGASLPFPSCRTSHLKALSRIHAPFLTRRPSFAVRFYRSRHASSVIPPERSGRCRFGQGCHSPPAKVRNRLSRISRSSAGTGPRGRAGSLAHRCERDAARPKGVTVLYFAVANLLAKQGGRLQRACRTLQSELWQRDVPWRCVASCVVVHPGGADVRV